MAISTPSKPSLTSRSRITTGSPEVTYRWLTDACERKMAFRFRYQIYIEEMQRQQQHADHNSKIIREPLDESGYILGAFTPEGEMVGTCRSNFTGESEIPYADMYQLNWLMAMFPSQLMFTSKLMVSPRFRSGRLFRQIAVEMFKLGLSKGALGTLIDCNDHLVGGFTKLGFRTVKAAQHPEYGQVTVMFLNHLDLTHLAHSRSPFLDHAQTYLTQKLFVPNRREDDHGSIRKDSKPMEVSI